MAQVFPLLILDLFALDGFWANLFVGRPFKFLTFWHFPCFKHIFEWTSLLAIAVENKIK